MRPLQALNLAMIKASSMGDDALVNALYAMRNDPASISKILLALDSLPDEDRVEAFADATGQYGYVMLPLVGEDAETITALGQRVRQTDLHEKGIEWEPHITALYGLHDQAAGGVGDVCKGFTPIAARLGAVGVFAATPQKPYDLLKVAVDSPDLMALNHALSRLPHTESYQFNPHATIAYLKPGRGAGYAVRYGSLAKELLLPCVIYSDPIKRVTAFPLGQTESFADWKEGTSPASGEHGWVSSGGQFRKEKPQGTSDEGKPDQSHARNVNQLGDTVATSLAASEPELKDNPGLVAKVKDAAITAGAHVLLAVQRIQDHWSGKVIGELVDAYFDSPNDMKKLGYNPGNSAQSASPKVRDDVSAAIEGAVGMGLSGHLVAKIAAEVLSRGFIFLRNKFRGGAQQMAEENMSEVAQTLADLYNQVNKSLGLDGVNDPKEIEKQLVALKAGTAQAFADWKAHTNLEGVSGWISSGGQFRRNKPGGADKPKEEDAQPKKEGQSEELPADPYEAAHGLAAKASDPITKDLLETALYNANSDDPADLAQQLANVYRASLVMKAPQATEVITKLLTHSGAEFSGPDQGEPVKYSGAAYESAKGLFPGDDAVVIQQPIILGGKVLLKGVAAVPGTKMSDNAPTELKPVTGNEGTKPASSEVALAGKDGAELNRVIQGAKDFGVKRVNAVMQQAAKRYTGRSEFLNEQETQEVASAIAAVNATAELLGRSRVRELQDRAESAHMGDDKPFAKFADAMGVEANPETAIATPEAALSYFQNLYPKIGIDTERWVGEQKRRAFTLAATMDANVTADIQKRISAALADHTGTADATHAIQSALTAAGVTSANPQYAEMVFRTNAMDAYQTGAYDEGHAKDVEDIFPVWQYLGIKDGRQGKDHEPHFDKYYPRSRAFADVRGDRPFNCRCSLRWVDEFEWDDLRKKGVREEG